MLKQARLHQGQKPVPPDADAHRGGEGRAGQERDRSAERVRPCKTQGRLDRLADRGINEVAWKATAVLAGTFNPAGYLAVEAAKYQRVRSDSQDSRPHRRRQPWFKMLSWKR